VLQAPTALAVAPGSSARCCAGLATCTSRSTAIVLAAPPHRVHQPNNIERR
jgi:hypothetical protein